jgi:hypothetical protein
LDPMSAEVQKAVQREPKGFGEHCCTTFVLTRTEDSEPDEVLLAGDGGTEDSEGLRKLINREKVPFRLIL